MEYSWEINIAEGFNGLIIYKGNESRVLIRSAGYKVISVLDT